MAANGDLLSPVLRELRTLLVTDREDPFGKEFGACPATSKSTNRPCQNPASKERRETARLLKESLDCHSEVRHDEGFYERLEEFFITIHCSIHRLAALQTFNAWKGRQLAATTKVLIPQTSDGIPMAALADGSDDMADADPQSIVSDALSDTSQETISPGDESELGLATASSTSTAVTTPGIDSDEPGIPSDSNESRPNTPTPASRRPAAPVMDRQPPLSEAKNPVPEPDQSELDEVLGQHGSDGPAVCIDIMRRFHSVKEKKSPLLTAIEKKFGPLDAEKGRVYVWKATNVAGVVKIGFTRDSSEARHEQNNNCYAKCAELFWQSEGPFIGAYRVEQIAQKAFAEKSVLHVQCAACGRMHKEWFALDAETAKESLKAWTEFVKEGYEGYDKKGLTATGRKVIDEALRAGLNPTELTRRLRAGGGVGLAAGVPVEEPAAAATVDTEESPADELVDDLDQERNPSRSDEVSTGPDACVEPLDISSIAVPDQPPTIPARSRFGRKIKESCKQATRHIKDAVKSRFSGGASGCSDRAGGGDEPQKAALSIRLSIRISSAELRQAVEAPHLDQPPSQT